MTYRSPVPNRGNSHFRGHDGHLIDYKYEDEVISWSWDVTDRLASGDTIASVSYDAQSGLTVNSESESGNVITFVLTNTGGLEVKVTTTNGEIFQETFYWYPKSEGDSDYNP